jgi:hypothetical protein
LTLTLYAVSIGILQGLVYRIGRRSKQLASPTAKSFGQFQHFPASSSRLDTPFDPHGLISFIAGWPHHLRLRHSPESAFGNLSLNNKFGNGYPLGNNKRISFISLFLTSCIFFNDRFRFRVLLVKM